MNQFEAEAQRRMDEERSSWETSKEEELQARLAEEKSTWESQQEEERKIISVDEGVAADEVERAAAKVYARLEQNGVSFGSGEAMDSAYLDAASVDAVKKSLLLGHSENNDEEDARKEEDSIRSMTENCTMSDEDASDHEDENNVESEGVDGKEAEELDSSSPGEDEHLNSPSGGEYGTGIEPERTNAEESTNDLLESAADSEDDLTSRSDSPDKDEVSSSSIQPFKNTWQLPPPQQHNMQPRSGVPFRAARKAFSRATGMHGLITPSTVQLRQQQKQQDEVMRKRQQQSKRQHQQQKGKTASGDKRAIVDDEKATSELLQGDNNAESTSPQSSFNDNNHSSASSSVDSPSHLQNAGSSPHSMMTRGNDSWGSNSSYHVHDDAGGYDGASSSSWDNNNMEQQPPLPEMDDTW
mmetsp:Transcript_31387/g.57467  ORF Transcript_31387/g.57467 Transcript_31387/m.57467 type:complete len:412 (+) Transcript_31387:322-1557(+)